MSQHIIYKRVFASLYSPDVLAKRPFGEAFVLTPGGRLTVQFGTPPDVIDLGLHLPIQSAVVLGAASSQEATTPDGHYRLAIDSFEQDGGVEFWLIHLDQAKGKFRRAKLSADRQVPPRIAVSPGGTFFLADDHGTVRLYDAATLHDLGVFEVAHAYTENRIAALAVSADDRLVAALSSWKDIVLYHVPERRVVSVRHIDDPVGWYDQAFILIAGNGAIIVTAGRIVGQNAAVSVNVFRYTSQDMLEER